MFAWGPRGWEEETGRRGVGGGWGAGLGGGRWGEAAVKKRNSPKPCGTAVKTSLGSRLGSVPTRARSEIFTGVR